MKYFKTIQFFIMIALILVAFSPDLYAVIQKPDPVPVPLDGGLLAALAGAGITYYIAKKKKKK